ncbi:hypothetical protein IWQ49_003915 [Labrenzia sp. EL_126]|nr:hypothetical protein [Labrenzia sp. EL_126]
MPKKYIFYAALAAALLFPLSAVHAKELPGLTWSDRTSKETADGDIKETPPHVEIGGIRLSRFSQMQALALEDTLTIRGDETPETLYVFQAWQGGASQGEQLMLLSVSSSGVDIIGPYPADFESLKIKPASADTGPVFDLCGPDSQVPSTSLEYFDGQLLKLN